MKKPTKHSVLVIGSVNMDLLLNASRVPFEGESLIGTHYCYIAGGKGANQAVALSRLGAEVTFVGRIGNDAHGAVLADSLRKEGVNTHLVVPDFEAPTGLAVNLVSANAHNMILVFPGANMRLSNSDLTQAFCERDYDALIMQLEVPTEVVIEACRLARMRAIPVILDAGPAQDFPLELVPGIAILTPNETETLALTGIEVNNLAGAEAAALRLICRSGAKAVVIKLGSRGALLLTAEGEKKYFPACKVDAVDATAAGDAFTAAMTIRYLESEDIFEAIAFGNVAGGLATTTLGAQCALPTRLQVEQFMQQSEVTWGADV